MAIPAPEYMSVNGQLQPPRPVAGPYVFQNVHTLGYRCRHMGRHIEILSAAALRLFGTGLRLDPQQAERQAVRLLEACRRARGVTVRIVLKAYPSGDVVMECDEPSIYGGYALRSLRPEAVCMAIAPAMARYPTSAMAETRSLADAMARAQGFHTAILTDSGGNIVSECCNPLFTVRGYTIATPPQPAGSVEMETAGQAARRASLAIHRQPLTLDDLAAADEVLTVNFQGITSMARIGNKPYMSIIAERLAACMEPPAR